ncbi:SPASM domain-containing protein [Pseudobutyrivibrio sp.]
MLEFGNIAYPLAKRLKTIVTDAGKSFQTFFVTKATLIRSKEIDMLKEINPYFQITLDGNRNKHNKVRIRKQSTAPTYEAILGAIKGIVDRIFLPENYKQPIITIRINYDNSTLAHLPDLISDLGDINRSAIMIHLERVWQTKDSVSDKQRMMLRETIHTLISEGFYVSHGCFGNKRVSCPAESVNYFIVNYDGNLYRCNGRTLLPELKEGELSQDGDIIWNESKQSSRLGLATFENPHCLGCKMLPRCMGPCSQKLAEHNGFSHKICTKASMDIPLDEYLLIEFEKRISICGYKSFK